MKRIVFSLLITFLLLPAQSFTQRIAPYVHWTYTTEVLGNGYVDLIFTAELKEEWTLYATGNTLMPLTFTFDKPDVYKYIGGMLEPPVTREYDPLLEAEMVYYNDKVVVFRQKIRVPAPFSGDITGTIKGQLCQKTNGICTLMEEKFVFTIGRKG